MEAQISKRDVDMSDYYEFLSQVAPESEEEESTFVTEADHQADNDLDVYDDDYSYDEGAQSQVSRTVPLPREEPTYDPSPEADMPDIDAKGKYSLKMVGQRRLLRQERSAAVNHLELPEATQSTLMANIDHSMFLIYCYYIRNSHRSQL